MYGDEIRTPVTSDLHPEEERFARLGVDQVTIRNVLDEPFVDEREHLVDERERHQEADEQGRHRVGDALAQLVEMFEEAHPAFAGFLRFFAEGRARA